MSSTNIAQEVVSSQEELQKRKPFEYTVEEALCYLVSNNLTTAQYKSIRQGAIDHNHKLYPSYYSVLKAKKDSYPSNLFVSETICEVPLQSLLDHTCSRILQYVKPTIANDSKLELICKWGFDGSSGYSIFKQKWLEDNGSDEHLFVTALVPLKLPLVKIII